MTTIRSEQAISTQAVKAISAERTATGRYRWYICGLLFFASVINYIDRQVIGILKPTLQQQFGWSELDYGDIVFSFQLAYAIGFIGAGRLMDRRGHAHRVLACRAPLECRRNRNRRCAHRPWAPWSASAAWPVPSAGC